MIFEISQEQLQQLQDVNYHITYDINEKAVTDLQQAMNPESQKLKDIEQKQIDTKKELGEKQKISLKIQSKRTKLQNDLEKEKKVTGKHKIERRLLKNKHDGESIGVKITALGKTLEEIKETRNACIKNYELIASIHSAFDKATQGQLHGIVKVTFPKNQTETDKLFTILQQHLTAYQKSSSQTTLTFTKTTDPQYGDKEAVFKIIEEIYAHPQKNRTDKGEVKVLIDPDLLDDTNITTIWNTFEKFKNLYDDEKQVQETSRVKILRVNVVNRSYNSSSAKTNYYSLHQKMSEYALIQRLEDSQEYKAYVTKKPEANSQETSKEATDLFVLLDDEVNEKGWEPPYSNKSESYKETLEASILHHWGIHYEWLGLVENLTQEEKNKYFPENPLPPITRSQLQAAISTFFGFASLKIGKNGLETVFKNSNKLIRIEGVPNNQAPLNTTSTLQPLYTPDCPQAETRTVDLTLEDIQEIQKSIQKIHDSSELAETIKSKDVMGATLARLFKADLANDIIGPHYDKISLSSEHHKMMKLLGKALTRLDGLMKRSETQKEELRSNHQINVTSLDHAKELIEGVEQSLKRRDLETSLKMLSSILEDIANHQTIAELREKIDQTEMPPINISLVDKYNTQFKELLNKEELATKSEINKVNQILTQIRGEYDRVDELFKAAKNALDLHIQSNKSVESETTESETTEWKSSIESTLLFAEGVINLTPANIAEKKGSFTQEDGAFNEYVTTNKERLRNFQYLQNIKQTIENNQSYDKTQYIHEKSLRIPTTGGKIALSAFKKKITELQKDQTDALSKLTTKGTSIPTNKLIASRLTGYLETLEEIEELKQSPVECLETEMKDHEAKKDGLDKLVSQRAEYRYLEKAQGYLDAKLNAKAVSLYKGLGVTSKNEDIVKAINLCLLLSTDQSSTRNTLGIDENTTIQDFVERNNEPSKQMNPVLVNETFQDITKSQTRDLQDDEKDKIEAFLSTFTNQRGWLSMLSKDPQEEALKPYKDYPDLQDIKRSQLQITEEMNTYNTRPLFLILTDKTDDDFVSDIQELEDRIDQNKKEISLWKNMENMVVAAAVNDLEVSTGAGIILLQKNLPSQHNSAICCPGAPSSSTIKEKKDPIILGFEDILTRNQQRIKEIKETELGIYGDVMKIAGKAGSAVLDTSNKLGGFFYHYATLSYNYSKDSFFSFTNKVSGLTGTSVESFKNWWKPNTNPNADDTNRSPSSNFDSQESGTSSSVNSNPSPTEEPKPSKCNIL